MSATVSYVVHYVLNGGFRPPVDNPTAVNRGPAGRTYPAKFQLSATNGAAITARSAVTSIGYQRADCTSFVSSPTDAVVELVGQAGTGLSVNGGQYHYNWDTPRTPGCYVLRVMLDSGQQIYTLFNLG